VDLTQLLPVTGAGGLMAAQAWTTHLPVKDAYAHLIATRNLEINLFWQRSNYFLVLNTAIALGFFELEHWLHALIFAVLGVAVSLLWVLVCLGSKFWQARWEGRLSEFEREHLTTLKFFGVEPSEIADDVEKGLGLSQLRGIKRLLYQFTLTRRPSVSFSMLLLALLFLVAWLVLIVVFFVGGCNPLLGPLSPECSAEAAG
jgi:hypothetical protein